MEFPSAPVSLLTSGLRTLLVSKAKNFLGVLAPMISSSTDLKTQIDNKSTSSDITRHTNRATYVCMVFCVFSDSCFDWGNV